MNATKTGVKLPEDHRQYADKYFVRTKEILMREGLNPVVSMNVFTRGEGRVAGLEEAVEILDAYSDIAKTGEVWVSRNQEYYTKMPLMVIKGPVQSFVELETMYLGVISAAITAEKGISKPEPGEIKAKLERLTAIYGDKPITYFGARHYHWSLDKEIAAAALEGGAVQTSTDIGSSNIEKEGVGTTPHLLTIVLGAAYGVETATLRTAQLFDKYMPASIPRVTLIDTFNRELTDSLMVARYFGERKSMFRIDTCGENVGEGGTIYAGNNGRDPEYRTGTGVTIELVTNFRVNMINNGFGESTDIFLSSGFGDEEKARAFVKADKEFREKTGYSLFAGVGIGEVTEAKFATADIFEVEGKPFSKTGREIKNADYSKMERVL